MPPDPSLRLRLLKVAYWAFIATIAFSVAGMLLLKLVPAALTFFGPYYPTLVKAPTWTYMALLPVLPLLMYADMLSPRQLLYCLLWGSLVGAGSELLGTTTGFPFGAYTYVGPLGPKIAGHVPYFIPLSWFAMSIVCYDLAGRLTKTAVHRVLLASLFMVLWDVSLDPAMGRFAETTFWYYPNDGFYYGMPLSNWLGWFGVSVVIMAGYAAFLRETPIRSEWASRVFLLNCLFPLLLCLLYGLFVAFFIGLLATALPLVAVRRAQTPLPSAPIPT